MGAPIALPRVWTLPFCWILLPQKKFETYHLFPYRRPHIDKKVSLMAFRQILPNTLTAASTFRYKIMFWLNKLVGTKSLNTKQCPAGLCLRIIPPCPPSNQKCFSPLMLLCSPHQVWTVLSSLELLWKTLGMEGESQSRAKNFFILPTRNLYSSLSKVSFHPHQVVFLMY